MSGRKLPDVGMFFDFTWITVGDWSKKSIKDVLELDRLALAYSSEFALQALETFVEGRGVPTEGAS